MPDVGEGLTEAEILGWRVAVGDPLAVNQILVEIETAKAAVELPSPFAGRVPELLAQPGYTVRSARRSSSSRRRWRACAATPPSPIRRPATRRSRTGPGAKIGEVAADGRIATLVGYGPRPGSAARRPRRPAGRPPSDGSATPLRDPGSRPTERPAAEVGGAPARLADRTAGRAAGAQARQGPGHRPAPRHRDRADGVITRDDVERARIRHAAAAAPAAARCRPRPRRERRVPIKGVRKATAAAMVASAFTAPHVTEFLTVDVTATIELRHRLRSPREYAEVQITPLTFVAPAVCLAARRTPEVNARWDEAAARSSIERTHLGIAAATPRGLIVPNIKDADTAALLELAVALCAHRDRPGRQDPPSDMAGGTFTITNVGVFGVDTGTPIINPGESAILALGSIKGAPWVVDGQLAVRTVGQLALSFDHRLIDGEQGSRFLADVGALLTDPGLALTW